MLEYDITEPIFLSTHTTTNTITHPTNDNNDHNDNHPHHNNIDTNTFASRASVTLIALRHTRRHARPYDEFGFLDVSLDPPINISDQNESGSGKGAPVGTVTTSWEPAPTDNTDAANSSGYYVFMLSGTVHAGAARIVAFTGLTKVDLVAYTVHGGYGASGLGRSIEARRLSLEEMLIEGTMQLAWDGLRGRLCILVSPSQMEVLDYV